MAHAIEPGRTMDQASGCGVSPRRRLGRGLLALLMLLLGRAAPGAGAEATPASGTLSARQEGDEVAVTCRGDVAWKAVVDRAHGGVVRHFSIPDDGPNLVAEE